MIKIYKYTNIVNNKVYVGQTTQNLSKRANSNGSGYVHCLKFYADIQKYGWDKFVPEILYITDDKEIADQKEQYYISLYNSVNNGYNIDHGGTKNKIHSIETKIKISNSTKGNNNSRARNVCINGVPTNKTIRDYANENNLNENTLKYWCVNNKNGFSYL